MRARTLAHPSFKANYHAKRGVVRPPPIAASMLLTICCFSVSSLPPRYESAAFLPLVLVCGLFYRLSAPSLPRYLSTGCLLLLCLLGTSMPPFYRLSAASLPPASDVCCLSATWLPVWGLFTTCLLFLCLLSDTSLSVCRLSAAYLHPGYQYAVFLRPVCCI